MPMSSPRSRRDGLVRKIVKDAVGVDVVLPPRTATATDDNQATHTIETHPLLEPYRNQGGEVPKLTTYGHRPSSASRVFNPSTMGVTDRLSQSASNDKPGTALMNASVLRQILPEHKTRNTKSGSTTSVQNPKAEPAEPMPAYPEGSEMPRAVADDAENGRPAWDEDFLLKPSAKSRYQLKSNFMAGEQKMTTRERLDRFVTKATAMETDTIYCKEKRELDRHFNRMQYDADYRAAQDKLKAAEQRLQRRNQQPSQEAVAIREIMKVRKDREHMLEKRVKTYKQEQAMNSVPDVNYDGALFNAAFKKTIEQHTNREASLSNALDQSNSFQQHQSAPQTPNKQTKMRKVYSEEVKSIESSIGSHWRTHTPSRNASQATAAIEPDEKSHFLQYIESQPDVQSIVQEALRGT